MDWIGWVLMAVGAIVLIVLIVVGFFFWVFRPPRPRRGPLPPAVHDDVLGLIRPVASDSCAWTGEAKWGTRLVPFEVNGRAFPDAGAVEAMRGLARDPQAFEEQVRLLLAAEASKTDGEFAGLAGEIAALGPILHISLSRSRARVRGEMCFDQPDWIDRSWRVSIEDGKPTFLWFLSL